jgi:hypothetical protein
MAKKQKPIKSEQEVMIENIKDRLSDGEELRDIAAEHGMSCRAICRLIAEVPKEDSDVLDLSGFDLGDPLGPSESDSLKFEYD